MTRIALWRTRSDSLTHLRRERPEQVEVVEQLLVLVDRCIDAYEASASSNTYARVCGLTLLFRLPGNVRRLSRAHTNNFEITSMNMHRIVHSGVSGVGCAACRAWHRAPRTKTSATEGVDSAARGRRRARVVQGTGARISNTNQRGAARVQGCFSRVGASSVPWLARPEDFAIRDPGRRDRLSISELRPKARSTNCSENLLRVLLARVVIYDACVPD